MLNQTVQSTCSARSISHFSFKNELTLIMNFKYLHLLLYFSNLQIMYKCYWLLIILLSAS